MAWTAVVVIAVLTVVAVAGLFVDVTSPMLITPWGAGGIRVYEGYVALELRAPGTPSSPFWPNGGSVARHSWGGMVEVLHGHRIQSSTRYEYRSFGVGFLTWIALLLVTVAAWRKHENMWHKRGFPVTDREG